MNDNMSCIYQTEINFVTRNTVRKFCKILFYFLVKTAVKFRILQISEILNTDTNRIFPITFQVMYISLKYK